jgi:hypothetical protein
MRPCLRFLSFATLALAGILAIDAPRGVAAPEIDHCSEGEASSFFQEAPRAFNFEHDNGAFADRLGDHGFALCQYRVFLDKWTFTFCEYDTFVGGLYLYWDYEAQGMTREDAIADIEAVHDRVWLARRDRGKLGPRIEQPLQSTAYKDLQDPEDGKIVFQHRAFFGKLPVGEYESFWEETYFDEVYKAQVHLVILPHEEAH